MKSRNSPWFAAALGGMLLWGAGARADFTITYFTVGTFASSSSPTYTAPDGSTVTYTNTGTQTVTAPPESQVSLGTFTTASSAPSTAPVSVGDTFTLDLIVTAFSGPDQTVVGHDFQFTGHLNGTLSATTATGNIVFTPLSEAFGGVTFRIASNDSTNGIVVPGAVNLGAPTTNGGTTTLNGAVNVPEPSSIALLCLGGSTFVGLAFRRGRVKAREALAA